MGIPEQVQKDMTDAMRARDERRLSALRMAKAAFKNREVEKRSPLSDQEAMQVLSTLIKQRRESVEQFTKGGRPELAEKEAGEIALLEAYLPKAAGEEEIVAAVQAKIRELGSPSIKEMGAVMKAVMAQFQSSETRVEGKQVSEIVKRELSKPGGPA